MNIFVLLYSVKKGTFFLEGGAVEPNTFPPPLLLKIILVFSGLVLYLYYNFSLHENCPITEFFLVRIWTLFKQCFCSTYYDEGYYEARLEQGSSDIY